MRADEEKAALIEQLQDLLLDAERIGAKLWKLSGEYEGTMDGKMMGHIYDADWCLNELRKEVLKEDRHVAR